MSFARSATLLFALGLYTACSGGGGGGTAPEVPGPPAVVSVPSGNNQAVAAGTQAGAISVKVADSKGLGVPSQTVNFTVAAGGGSFGGSSSASAVTNASGLATLPAWTVGKSNVSQTVTATSGPLTGTVSASIATNYSVQVIFFGGTPSPELQTAFTAAAARLSAIITGGPAPFTFSVTSTNSSAINSGLAECGANVSVAIGNITGVVIYARDTSSLGPGTIATAGPCLVRSASQLTLFGVMVFSRAFVPTFTPAQLNDVVLHEMTHVLGFNPVQWSLLPDTAVAVRLIVNGGATPPNGSFRGSRAVAACLALPSAISASCSPTIPLENVGGAGSVDSHWRESIFRSELMTSTISNSDSGHPFSTMTVGAMGDLGYFINPAAADAYTFGSSVMLNLQAIRAAQGVVTELRLNDDVTTPIGSISPGGKLTRFRSPQ